MNLSDTCPHCGLTWFEHAVPGADGWLVYPCEAWISAHCPQAYDVCEVCGLLMREHLELEPPAVSVLGETLTPQIVPMLPTRFRPCPTPPH